MARPFEGIRVINVTHVLAGPFSTYQLAVLGADVIKVEHPDEPDQSRSNGTHKALNQVRPASRAGSACRSRPSPSPITVRRWHSARSLEAGLLGKGLSRVA
jgi:hypothetical protein